MGRADELLERIVTTLRANSNVQAVWLSGSRGRGTNDEFSDIDLWVAVEDSAMISIAADPVKFIHSIVPTIMEVNAPAIAPPEGAFVGSWVPVEDQFVQVDWYLAVFGTIAREADTRVLFGDVPILSPDAMTVLSPETVRAKVLDQLVQALQRVNLMIKRARRGDMWEMSNAARNADTNLVTAQKIFQDGRMPEFVDLETTFLHSPLPASNRDVQMLATHLIDQTRWISSQTNVLPELQEAINGLSRLLEDWQSTDWLPAEEYYRRLPRRYMGAGMLITDAEDRVLLVETTYKTQFEIPGGVCDAGESPSVTAAREVREELGITIPIGPLLVLDHRTQPQPKGDAIMFVYDGGVITSPELLKPDGVEIKRFHFVPIDRIDGLVTDRMAARLRAALRARDENRVIEVFTTNEPDHP